MQTRTFLFADLRDYTKFVERHGDAAAATLIGDYRRLVRAEVARHEGAEVKTEGDSFYVVFSSAQAALRCGMAVLGEADQYSTDRPDRPMKVGVGIHAGEPQPHEGQFVGEAVIVAARLAQQSGPGELLVTEVVRALLPHGAMPDMQEREGLTLKGIERAPRVFRVEIPRRERPAEKARPADTAVPAAPPTGAIVAHELIGREAEARALAGFLEGARAGAGRLVLVSGEAGLGKTALTRRFMDEARAAGTPVLVGECTEIEARRPFGPFIDALASAGLQLPSEFRVGGPGAQAMADVDRHVAHGALMSAIRELATGGPRLLVLEDIHWADPSTRELIEHLPRQLRSLPLLVVATYRSDELHRRHPLNQTLAELDRSRMVPEVRLDPLDEDETARLIASALRLERPPTAEFRRAVHDRCAGNPFFTEEVLRALVERGDLRYEAGSWRRSKAIAALELPRTVRAAVEQRLQQLPERSLHAIRVAAVIGARFEFDLLAKVAQVEERDLVRILAEAIEVQLIVEESGAREETYRFRHALTREAVLEELLARERRLLHRGIAEEIERRAGSDVSRHLEELAYHFDEGRDVEKAIEYRLRAAEASLVSGAPSRALEHVERALEAAPPDHPRSAEVHLALARAASKLDVVRATSAAETAARLYQERGDPKGQGAALVEVTACHTFAGRRLESTAARERAIALLEPLGPSRELARAYAARGWAALFAREADALEHWQRALEVAGQVGDHELQVGGKDPMAIALLQRGRPDEAVALMRTAIDESVRHGFVRAENSARHNLIYLLAATRVGPEEHARARDEYLRFAARLERGGPSRGSLEIDRAIERGEWDEALGLIEDAPQGDVWDARNRVEEAYIRAARDGPAADVSRLADLAGLLRTSGAKQWARAAADAARAKFVLGDVAGALADSMTLVDHEEEIAPSQQLALGLLCADLLDDTAALDALGASVRRHALAGGVPDAAVRLPESVAASIAAERAADVPLALVAYERAADLAQRWWHWLVATEIRLRRAKLLAQAGDLSGARAELDRVLPYWRKAKATWYLGELEKKARAMGIELAAAGG